MRDKLFSVKAISIDSGLLLLRIFSGLFMMYYGWDKLVHFDEKAADWVDPFLLGGTISLGLTILAELICPVFITIGLYTRVALIPAVINMVVAILVGHSGQPLIEREHAFSYLIPYVVIFLAGPGRYSLDGFLRK